MKKKRLINWLCLSGVISVIFYLLHDIIGSLNYPGYNWMAQAVSDLTATDAPSYIIARGYSAIYGIFSCMCCVLLCILIRNRRSKVFRIGIYLFSIMNLVSAIGYSLFPLTSNGYDGSIQSFIHVYVITIIVVLLSIVSLVLIAIGSYKDKYKSLMVISIIALIFMFIGAAGSQFVSKKIFGIIERFSTYSAVIYTGILGLYGFHVFRS